MVTSVDVAIIGAGPYGLSIAAHLGARGIDFRIFGEPMQTWRRNMPPGMFLKSDGKGSDISDPGEDFTLAEFCRTFRVPYDPTHIPVKLETFAAYGDAFQQRFAPRVERRQLTRLERSGERFDLHFDDGEWLTARHVIISVGVVPLQYVPDMFATLPAELVSHSSEFGSLERLDGRDVTIVGAGSSALDLAALSLERGTPVTVVTRAERVVFHGEPSTVRRDLLSRIREPDSKMGAGWVLRICDDAPWFIHALPDRLRLKILNKMLGPSGGYFVRDKVLGEATLKCGRTILSAAVGGDKVLLRTQAADGSQETIASDHLILATGYRPDVEKLAFLSGEIRRGLELIEKAPVLSRNFESSVPGLYFAGFMAAPSFGPVMRFVAGTPHPARQLARHLARFRRPNAILAPSRAVG
jgi:thioredoxin reductase